MSADLWLQANPPRARREKWRAIMKQSFLPYFYPKRAGGPEWHLREEEKPSDLEVWLLP